MVNVMANGREIWQEVRLYLSHTGDSVAQGRREVKPSATRWSTWAVMLKCRPG